MTPANLTACPRCGTPGKGECSRCGHTWSVHDPGTVERRKVARRLPRRAERPKAAALSPKGVRDIRQPDLQRGSRDAIELGFGPDEVEGPMNVDVPFARRQRERP